MNRIKIYLFAWCLFAVPCMAQDLLCTETADELYAVFTPKILQCNENQFLPANSIECSDCPEGYSCNGGFLTFNSEQASGINFTNVFTNSADNLCAVNLPSELYAIYVPRKIECRPGYYLLENNIECVKCLSDNYCPGGTYTFNEALPQGIVQCPDMHPFAPAGMWTESQCGRKLHVGDDVLYLHQAPATPTARRLYVRFNDVVYSANATEVAIAPTTMSEYAKRALHVIIDGVEYLIHDDSAK